MTVYYTLKDSDKLTQQQLAELAALEDRPPVPDEESPEISPERYMALLKATEARENHGMKRNA